MDLHTLKFLLETVIQSLFGQGKVRSSPRTWLRKRARDQEHTQRIGRWVAGLCPATVKELASDKVGCRFLQVALLHVDLDRDKSKILRSLLEWFQEAYKSPHANHVLQQLIKLLPVDYLDGVIQKVAGEATTIAKHKFGCRVLERLIEHSSEGALGGIGDEIARDSEALCKLGGIRDEIARDSEALCKHEFGNYVIQKMLSHGSHKNRAEVLEQMLASSPALAGHRTASHVVKCMVDELLKQIRLLQAGELGMMSPTPGHATPRTPSAASHSSPSQGRRN